MSWPRLDAIATQVKDGKTTAESLVEQSLQAIQATADYHTVLEVNEAAREQAQRLDRRIKEGQPAGRLAGVPFIAKDNFLTRRTRTTAASNMLKNFTAPYQATAVERLEAEGAILVAKANLDAFAHGSSTENSDFGPTRNPHDESRVPGGSSGGSAAAVILDQVPFALGTDTGGSIRLPASFCGAVGYKPTYGLVSRYGVVAMASSTDVIGPLARTVEDVALVLDVMAGPDAYDATTIDREQHYTGLPTDVDGLKIGVVQEHLNQDVEPAVRDAVQSATEQLNAAGATVETVSMPSDELALASYYIIVPAEISSNLERYDGVKYGLSDPDAASLEATYRLSRAHGFNDENKRRIMTGTYVLSSGYYDAYYKQAQTVRTKLIQDYDKTFQKYDVLVGPTAPTTAFKLGERTQDPLHMYLTDAMTVGASLAGLPAASVPVGVDNGLPVGLQVVGPQRQDRRVLEAAAAIQQLAGGSADG